MYMERAVITYVGRDQVGIIARSCTYLATHGVNILDISQTIVHGFFNMMMIVDYGKADCAFSELSDGLSALGQKMGIEIRCQKEEIFEEMHRV